MIAELVVNELIVEFSCAVMVVVAVLAAAANGETKTAKVPIANNFDFVIRMGFCVFNFLWLV